MSNMSLSNAGSPFSEVKLYVGRENKGFIVTPKSDTAPDGWGKPFKNANGDPITPGTVGEPENKRFVSKRPGKSWTSRQEPGTQMFGEISWLGADKRVGVAAKGKWVLTYHGPNTRYFPTDAFAYGTEDTHNNIYCEGLCIAVAPHAVMGAALRPYTNPNGEPAFRLIAVCWTGHEDAIYIRNVAPAIGVFESDYNDDFRNAQMKMYNITTNPDGWRLLGYVQCVNSSQGVFRTVKKARTPWFFDSTGTVAQCMREATITVARGDKSEEQEGYVRYKLTCSDNEVKLSCPDNTSGFTYNASSYSRTRPQYSNTCPYPGDSGLAAIAHVWNVGSAHFEIKGTGEYVIAVDYAGTEERLLKVKLDATITGSQWFYKGADGEPNGTPNQSNRFLWGGDSYPKIVDPTFVPYGGDGESSWWVGVNIRYLLVGAPFGDNFWLYRKLSGSKTEYDTGVDDPKDTGLYYYFTSRVWLHYLSLVRPHISFFEKEKVYQREPNPGWFSRPYSTDYEAYNRESSMSVANSTSFMDKPLPQEQAVYIGRGVGMDYGWDNLLEYEGTWSIGAPHAVSFTCVDGRYPVDYSWPSNTPDPLLFFSGTEMDIAAPWPSITDLLQSISNNYREGGHAEDSFSNHCVSIKYKDENGNDKYYNALNGATSTLTSVTGATGGKERFYKLGES